MTLVRFDPFRQLQRIQSRFFSDPFFGFGEEEDESGVSVRTWTPAVDVWENESEIGFSVELPGFEKSDIDISVNNNRLAVSGERRFEDVKEGRFFRVERSYGRFYRSFTLPNTVDADKITANLKNGVLTVQLPKKEEAKPKQIEVEVS